MKGTFELADERAEAVNLQHGDFVRIMGTFGRDILPTEPVDVDAKVYVRLHGEEYENFYSSEGHEQNLGEFMAQLESFQTSAPDGADAIIKFSSSYFGEGDTEASYEVGYWRDPTSEERAEREETNRKIAERDKANEERAALKEREMYERLKAKFGGE